MLLNFTSLILFFVLFFRCAKAVRLQELLTRLQMETWPETTSALRMWAGAPIRLSCY